MKYLLVVLLGINLFSIEQPISELRQATITTKLATELNLQTSFYDSGGNLYSLKEILANKTTILVPAYFGCPRLCGLVLDGVKKVINQLDLKLGQDFQIVSISFDDQDNAENAKKFEDKYRSLLKIEGDKEQWKFFTGTIDNISTLMSQLGFGYVKDKKDYAHSAAIFIISPGGKLSQYFTGINFSRFDLKLAIVEAAQGKVGGLLEHALLYCFRFDETKGQYSLAAMNLMRLGAVLTFIFLIVLFIYLRDKEKFIWFKKKE